MDRITAFKTALAESKRLYALDPRFETLGSIAHQIEYLIAVEEGRETNRLQLANIILGVQAAREIEQYDEGFAELLHRVAHEARLMQG